mgnify:CR=1 FL=1
MLGALVALSCAGCLVPQPRGAGELKRITEPTTRRGYWRYLPKEYVSADEARRRARRWPLVVSFHGMKPFDTAHRQALEWEQEADRYGFIVVAPELAAPDILQPFPLRRVTGAFQSDEKATLAILDHVFATTNADAGHVLSTSWSSGGYLAHYMVNQHPNRFTCLAVRQSNFSDAVLDPKRTEESRYHPILILMAQNEFAGVRHECQDAIKWYETHRYANFAWVNIKGIGHQRTPDTAAAFFARVAGVEPNAPPIVLVQRQAIAGNARGLAFLAGQMGTPEARPTRTATAGGVAAQREPTPSRAAAPPEPVRAQAPGPALAVASSLRNPGAASREPSARRSESPAATGGASPDARPRVSIRVSSAIGIEPLVLAFSADCPADWLRTADFLWTLDGEPLCNGVNGQKTITQPGEHTLGLLVVTPDQQEHRAHRLIRVLPRIDPARRTGGSDKE